MPECRVVAVENALSEVAQVLRERGYQVVDPAGAACSVGALVLSRGESGSAAAAVPLVVAGGRAAGEVADEVDRRYPRFAPWVRSTPAAEPNPGRR